MASAAFIGNPSNAHPCPSPRYSIQYLPSFISWKSWMGTFSLSLSTQTEGHKSQLLNVPPLSLINVDPTLSARPHFVRLSRGPGTALTSREYISRRQTTNSTIDLARLRAADLDTRQTEEPASLLLALPEFFRETKTEWSDWRFSTT